MKNELVSRLKMMKNASQQEIEGFLQEYSTKKVKEELAEAGVDWRELDEADLNELVADELAKNKTFAKGVLGGAGLIMLLNFLG
ncbi:MAG: hypothetical protein IBX50_16015 [Marinospirillum sp.]|uniref:hypothetical protein n=1 Tax=Marinospirillum sp. TaxID=2183934 RepID=UPI0019FCB69B|nr:hypothetical protein [Marinospirillum sp.]MBE0508196.1 hypothetical protein [Marinospirillum sp.]